MTLRSAPRAGRMAGQALTLRGLFAAFWPQITVTWGLTLAEVALFALVPLLIGLAIDGLLAGSMTSFLQLGGVLAGLTLLGTLRRFYDTRAYGLMRVELGKELASRAAALPVSRLNARIDMGRELADFLEQEVPAGMAAVIRSVAAVAVLASYHGALALTALAGLAAVTLVYAAAHSRFYHLNAALNGCAEQQVQVLERRSLPRLGAHLLSLRKSEVRLSDTEALVYGLIFAALLGMEMFNLWFAAQLPAVTAGMVFAIVTYSWDFVESALLLPMTLQSLSRLTEITARINKSELSA